MKKRMMLMTLGLVLVAGQAHATKARLEALGEDAYGSQFIDDNRNVFLNASTINNHKDFVTFEWGDATNTADATATPRAEGGFFKSTGNMAYGVYFGSESNTSNVLRSAAGLTDAAAHEARVLDVFVGGDAGWQWGASLTYTSTVDDTVTGEASQDALRGRFGFATGPWDGFLNFGISNNAEIGATEFQGGTSYDAGVGYMFRGNLKLMARLAGITAEQDTGAATNDFTQTDTRIGLAKKYRLNSKANVWVSGWYRSKTRECDFTGCAAAGLTAGDYTENYVPLAVAAEIAVKEWLTLRGSVTQPIFGEFEIDNGDKSSMDATTVAAGASLTFGDLQIDGMVGNNDAGDATPGADTSAGAGQLRTDALMSRVSMTYRF